MKVLVSVFNNLYTDQRVEKVCRTLHESGYRVELIGNTWEGSPEMSRPYPFYRIPLSSSTLRFAYVEFNKKLYTELQKRYTKDTILLANDLDVLLPNFFLAKRKKVPLVFDSHEIFTEQPSVQGRYVQHIWRFLEKSVVPKLEFMMTESASYARWFNERYSTDPVVVRNVPRRILEEICFPENSPKIVLYQGALNGSRGLFQAISAMKFVEGAVFKIAGDGPMRAQYEAHTDSEGLREKVQFLGKLVPDDLRKLTKTADVGIAMEENGGVSYYYSLPNKVPDYIQSRVPMVMINFPEIAAVREKFAVGEMIDRHDPPLIAEKIREIIAKGRASYAQALDAAAREYCWEHEEEKVRALFRRAASRGILQ